MSQGKYGGKAVQKWRKSASLQIDSTPVFKPESTWMMRHDYTAINRTVFTFKAGNKDYTLDNDSNGGKSTTELGLKKRYA